MNTKTQLHELRRNKNCSFDFGKENKTRGFYNGQQQQNMKKTRIILCSKNIWNHNIYDKSHAILKPVYMLHKFMTQTQSFVYQ